MLCACGQKIFSASVRGHKNTFRKVLANKMYQFLKAELFKFSYCDASLEVGSCIAQIYIYVTCKTRKVTFLRLLKRLKAEFYV